MKSNRTKMRIGATIAVLSLLFVIGAVSRQTVSAQDRNNPYGQGRNDRYDWNQNRRGRNWDNYGNYGGSFDLRQTALNAGYNEGLKDGTAARKRGRSSDYSNQSAYRKATKDYSSRLGDRELYRRYFREAYQTGYNDGLNQGRYDNTGNGDLNRNDNRDWTRNNDNNGNRRGRNWDRYDNYGGSSDLRQTALNAGYNEGSRKVATIATETATQTFATIALTKKPRQTTAQSLATVDSINAITGQATRMVTMTV